MLDLQINSVLDYNRLLLEYRDTQHYLYAESNEFIEKYYAHEEERLIKAENSELNDNVSSIQRAFQVSLAYHCDEVV